MSEAADYSIDPQMAEAMERMVKIVEEEGLPPLPVKPSPPESRARMEAERSWWNQDLPEMADVREEHIDGPNGPIRVRLLYPRCAPSGTGAGLFPWWRLGRRLA